MASHPLGPDPNPILVATAVGPHDNPVPICALGGVHIPCQRAVQAFCKLDPLQPRDGRAVRVKGQVGGVVAATREPKDRSAWISAGGASTIPHTLTKFPRFAHVQSLLLADYRAHLWDWFWR